MCRNNLETNLTKWGHFLWQTEISNFYRLKALVGTWYINLLTLLFSHVTRFYNIALITSTVYHGNKLAKPRADLAGDGLVSFPTQRMLLGSDNMKNE